MHALKSHHTLPINRLCFAIGLFCLGCFCLFVCLFGLVFALVLFGLLFGFVWLLFLFWHGERSEPHLALQCGVKSWLRNLGSSGLLWVILYDRKITRGLGRPRMIDWRHASCLGCYSWQRYISMQYSVRQSSSVVDTVGWGIRRCD